jgi:hypothetical protein
MCSDVDFSENDVICIDNDWFLRRCKRIISQIYFSIFCLREVFIKSNLEKAIYRIQGHSVRNRPVLTH